MTNSEGKITFHGMYFSIFGTIGTYRIKFMCEDKFDITDDIIVETSV